MLISWAVPGHTARAGDSPTLCWITKRSWEPPGACSVAPAPPPQPAARAQRPPVPQPAKSHSLRRSQRPPGWSPRSPLLTPDSQLTPRDSLRPGSLLGFLPSFSFLHFPPTSCSDSGLLPLLPFFPPPWAPMSSLRPLNSTCLSRSAFLHFPCLLSSAPQASQSHRAGCLPRNFGLSIPTAPPRPPDPVQFSPSSSPEGDSLGTPRAAAPHTGNRAGRAQAAQLSGTVGLF